MRNRLDKVMQKTYLPSTEEIIEGLKSENREHNILDGHQQEFEITHPLEKHHADISEMIKDQSF